MKITREDSDNGYAVVKVTIELSDYEKTVTEKLREYRMKAALPGFRPGKVPASLIQKRFGKPLLAEEVNSLLSNNLTNYLRDEKISILGDPLPNREQQKTIDWDQDSEFEFAFDIAISPEIKVIFDEAGAFDYYLISVDDKMIEDNIESIRMSYGTNIETEVVKEKSSVRGDFLQLAENGEKAEEAIVADGVLIAVDLMKDEEVRNTIIGKKAGDTVVFDPVKTFEDRHEVGHMLNISHEAAEKVEGDFSFTIRSILDFQKAELNEELFKKAYGEETEITTVEKFREKISEEISKTLTHSSDQKFAIDARDNLMNSIKISLPDEFLKRWLKELNKEMDEEQIEKDFPGFTKDLRWQLIKNSIIRDFEIGVEEEEVSVFARQIAISQFQQYGVFQIQDEHLDNYVKRIMENEEDRERIVRRLFENKVFALIKEKGILVEKEVSSEEFEAMMRNTEEEDV